MTVFYEATSLTDRWALGIGWYRIDSENSGHNTVTACYRGIEESIQICIRAGVRMAILYETMALTNRRALGMSDD